MKRYPHIIILAAITLLSLLSACGKEDKLDTESSVSIWVQRERSGQLERAASDTRVCIFYGVDTLEWKAASYEDAVAGILTNSVTGQTRTAGANDWAKPDMNGNLAFSPAQDKKAVLVACNRQSYEDLSVAGERIVDSKMYAYRTLYTEEGLSDLRVSLIFRPWEQRDSYPDSQWSMKNDNVPVNLYTVDPQVQKALGGISESCRDDAAVFIHYGVDTTQWKVRTYADSKTGTLTNEGDSSTRQPDAAITVDPTTGLYTFASPTGYASMVIIVHNGSDYADLSEEKQSVDSRMYCYGYIEVESGQSFPGGTLTPLFKPREMRGSYIESVWTMRNDNPSVIFNSYTLLPQVEARSGGGSENCSSNVLAFVHYVDDPQNWSVASWEDSKTGKLTGSGSGSRMPDLTLGEELTFVPGEHRKAIIVVHNARAYSEFSSSMLKIDSRMYAFRTIEQPDEVGEHTLPLTFRPWRLDAEYADRGWSMRNDNPPEVIPKP